MNQIKTEFSKQKYNLLFIGISGYEYPHVRVRCYRFAEQLKKHGFNTSVLSFKDHLVPEVTEPEMYSRGDRFRLSVVFKSIKRFFSQYRNCILYLQKLHYHAAGALLLARYFNWPYIVDYDDYEIGQDPHGTGLFCGFNRDYINTFFYGARTDRDITEKAARNALCCIAASHSLQAFLKNSNPRTFLIPTGVDTTVFHPGAGKREEIPFTFLWTGLVWGESIAENVRYGIEVFSEVHKQNPLTHLKIVGGGEHMAGVETFAQKTLPTGSYSFISWMPPDAMPEIMASCHVGLLPMVSDSLWNRSKSPTKLFEYFASGLPVIATSNNEARYVVEHGKNGYLADDQRNYIEAMLCLSKNPEIYRSMQHLARKTAENNYSMQVIGKNLSDILNASLPSVPERFRQ
ncbi:glycosyltransferase family 4 protein [bacterium]|nr:glycosyltransferase family 4 protein [candidate division CSSED10-310 bacterium]